MHRSAPPCYHGSLLGVTALVLLHDQAGYAEIRLRGVPFGGSVHGRARFNDEGGVVVDASLDRAMSRRCCRVVNVTTDEVLDTLDVVVQLPLLGRRAITLKRIHLA